MKCLTCGKTVKRGQTECAFCGAMVGEQAPKSYAAKPGGFREPTFEEQKTPAARETAAKEAEWPVFEPMGEEVPSESAPDSSAPSAPARPPPPAWVRLISPIFFILVFLATQYWLRDSGPSRPSRSEQPAASQPTLRQGVFAGSLAERGVAETRTVFSLQEDRQIIFISTWRGSPDGHNYAVEWDSPAGPTHRSSITIEDTGGEFTLTATLELDPSFVVGLWRLQVFQDGEVVSRYTFQLKE